MARCAKGHEYDDNVYNVCPICNSNFNHSAGRVISFESNDSSGIGKTVPTGGFVSRNDVGYSDDIVTHMGPGFEDSTGSGVGKTQPISENKTPKNPDSVGNTTFIGGTKDPKNEGACVNPLTVGWLVCVEGHEKGKSFSLLPKINSVGRGDRNDVCLKGDTMITSGKQVKVAYDHKSNSFFVIPGEEAQNTSYLNDKPLYTMAELKAFDVIELGNTKLVFVPFCGENFKWDFETGENK